MKSIKSFKHLRRAFVMFFATNPVYPNLSTISGSTDQVWQDLFDGSSINTFPPWKVLRWVIKITSSAANLNFKWKKKTSERKQTKLHQNMAFIKDQKAVTKKGIFNTHSSAFHAREIYWSFSSQKHQETVTFLGLVSYFCINKFADMQWEFCCKSLKLNCFEINEL